MALRLELLALIARDDEVRARLAADGSLFQGYHPEMESVHRENAARLRAVIAEHGWPGRTLVDEDGAAAAWRIVQHSIGEPDFMRSCLVLLQEAATNAEADAASVAYLEDRIQVYEGRPQRYGTQYDWDMEGRWMVPMGGVEEPEAVDERRAAVGLPPIEWRREPPSGEAAPADIAGRQREMHEWAVRIGWRRR